MRREIIKLRRRKFMNEEELKLGRSRDFKNEEGV